MARILEKAANPFAERLQGIRGGEAAAALGVDKYVSKLELWAQKTERLDFCNDNERMRLGRDLEAYVAIRFTEATGKRVRKTGEEYLHDEFDFAIADLDREVIGENAALECKTVNTAFEKLPEKFEELPRHFLAQCYHYLAVMRFEKIYLAALDLWTGGLRIYEIPYDEEKCAKVMDAEKRFWYENVKADIRPEPDGSDSAELTLTALVKPIHGEPVTLSGEHSKTAGELFELRKSIKESEAREKILRQELIAAMDGNSAAVTEKYRLAFSRQNRRIIDSKLLRENHAEIYEECLRSQAANILKISEI